MALVAAMLINATAARAQEMEPRAYSNAPVRLNFLILGYAYTTGDVSLDTSLPIEDAKVSTHSALLAYARSFGVWGRSGKVDLVLPYAWLSGSTKVARRSVATEVSGLGHPQVRLSYLVYGGPALTVEQFSSYEPDLIIGVSLAVRAPLGQYDSDRLVNIVA